MNSREIELKKLGFRRNEHQEQWELSKFGYIYRVLFYQISNLTEQEWNVFIEESTRDFNEDKKQHYEALKLSEGYNFREKEFKKEIKDKYNHYNSKLKEVTKTKLDRRDRTEYVIKLESKVEILKEMMEYVDKQ